MRRGRGVSGRSGSGSMRLAGQVAYLARGVGALQRGQVDHRDGQVDGRQLGGLLDRPGGQPGGPLLDPDRVDAGQPEQEAAQRRSRRRGVAQVARQRVGRARRSDDRSRPPCSQATICACRPPVASRSGPTPTHATVNPLELFFDLVFVFALTQVTAFMADNLTWQGLLRGVLDHRAALVGVDRVRLAGQCGQRRRARRSSWRILVAMSAMFVLALCIPEAFRRRRGRAERADRARRVLPAGSGSATWRSS